MLPAVEMEYLLETSEPQVIQVFLHIGHGLLLLPLLLLLVRTQLYLEHLQQLEGLLPFDLRLKIILFQHHLIIMDCSLHVPLKHIYFLLLKDHVIGLQHETLGLGLRLFLLDGDFISGGLGLSYLGELPGE